MFRDTAYDTIMGSASNVKPIQHAIEKALITSELRKVTLNLSTAGEYKPLFVTGVLPSDAEIPLFTHPISVLTSKAEKYLCTDLRLFVRQDASIEDIDSAVKNRTEFNFVKSRAILNLLWLNGEVDQLKITLSFASTVFAAWLSETIAKSYSLDFGDQTKLNIISLAYYQMLFSDSKELSGNDVEKLVVHIIKATKLPATVVYSVVERITVMNDINDYCSTVAKLLENVRLEKFNLAALLTIVANSWYGTANKEIIAVALEHPPTWISMVYTALSERTYKTSRVYQIAERYGKRGGSDSFEEAFIRIMKESTVEVAKLHVREF